MFASIELWVVLLLVPVGALLLVLFGAAVLDAERETGKFGRVGLLAQTVAEIPDSIRRLIHRDKRIRVHDSNRFKGEPTGWSFPNGPMTGPQGYLLLSRYDGSIDRHAIELVSMPDMKLRYRWTPDVSTMLASSTRVSRFALLGKSDRVHFREIHPWMAADGDLIVKDHFSPLIRIDPCSRPRWVIDDRVFHHSTEADADGNLWIPSDSEKISLQHTKPSLHEDVIAKVSQDGKVLYTASVPQILVRHGYTNWLFASDMYNDDPIHLNDIEPVLADGDYWKKGDVFLSLRNQSTIMLYRPSTDQIVWMKRGPWLSQHDVDILDDHRISVYDNNAQDRGRNVYVDGFSRILIYDFATDTITAPLDKVMRENMVRTVPAGLFTLLPDGSSLIEDVTDAQLFIARPDGHVAARFVNRADNGFVYHLGWSRFVPKAEGDAALAHLSKAKCAA